MQGDGSADLAELTDLIYGCLFGETGWQAFLDRFATTVPDGKAALHYHDLSSHDAHVPYMSGFSVSEIDQFTRHFAAANPWIPRTTLVPVGQGVTGEDLLPHERLIKTEFYNDWLRPQNCETSVGVTVIREPTRTFVLSTCTSSTDTALNRQVAGLYTALSPHLKRAVDFVRKADIAAGERQAGQALLDSIGVGVVYVSENRSIRSLNDSAKQMVTDGAPLRIAGNGRITFECQTAMEDLEHLTSRQGVQSGPRVTIIKGANHNLYRLTLVRMKSDVFTEFLNGPTVAIIVEPTTTATPDLQRERLMASFKLTPKEIRVASAILSGLSPKEMALADGVSYETVRTHMKSIYAKLQVNSQAALVALLMR